MCFEFYYNLPSNHHNSKSELWWARNDMPVRRGLCVEPLELGARLRIRCRLLGSSERCCASLVLFDVRRVAKFSWKRCLRPRPAFTKKPSDAFRKVVRAGRFVLSPKHFRGEFALEARRSFVNFVTRQASLSAFFFASRHGSMDSPIRQASLSAFFFASRHGSMDSPIRQASRSARAALIYAKIRQACCGHTSNCDMHACLPRRFRLDSGESRSSRPPP